MATAELNRLEEQIGRVLRLGVGLCAAALFGGLILSFMGSDRASLVLRIGLAILMAIPVTRIVASFVDAVRRHDTLLASSTAIVLIVMAITLWYSMRSVDADAAEEITHTFSVALTLAPSGKQMAYVANVDGRDQLYVITFGGGPPRRLITHDGNDDSPAWSPDGKLIAFVSDVAGQSQLFVINSDGTGLQQVTREAGAAIDPSWAPDSDRLAYSVQTSAPDAAAQFELVEIRKDGTGRRFITHDGAVDTFPSWSPDGSQLAFRKVVGSNSEIFAVNTDGTGERNLTNDAAFDGWPAWSPDGRHIAFASDRRSHDQIFVMDTDGSHPTLVANTLGQATTPRWSADSKSIYFTNCSVSGTNPDCRILKADLRQR
jgi:TolB protein